VIIFSDFVGFDDQAQRAIGGLLSKLNFVAVQIADPLEMQLPAKGRFSFASGSSERLNNVSMDRRKQVQHQKRFQAHTDKLAAFFASGRNRHLQITTNQALDDAATELLKTIGSKG